VELGKTSLEKIWNPAAVELSWLTVVILLVSVAVKLWMYGFNTRLGKLIQSQTLLATAADSRNDCITTSMVLAAAMVEGLWNLRVDGMMGLGVAIFILFSGWGLARQTISPLLGEGTNPELRERILADIRSHPKVLGYHDLMVHDYGPGQRFASLHVEMDKDEDPLYCHEIIDDLERECFEKYGIRLVIHYDPVVTNDPKLDRMRTLVTAILKVRDERLSIHDFRMVPGEGHTNLIFDVALPCDLSSQEKTIQAALETALNDLGEEKFYTVITFDHEAFN
jgi:divalent metal cation (Fe/Co/Zn/Cd) transporter